MQRLLAALLALSALLLTAGPATADSILDQCVAQTCKARLTADQVLDEAQKLVLAKRFDEARPLIAALAAVPSLHFESQFLTGYVAEQTGDYHHAEAIFRAILVDDPKQTRVRLELARTLLSMGKTQKADHQFRLAAQAPDLPPEITRTIRSVRNIIRSKRAWTLDLALGIAPDTNINNATGADSITVLFGTQPIPLTLGANAQAKSGVGVNATIDSGLRLPIAKNTALLVDFNAGGTLYKASAYNDVSAELAVGPEVKLSEKLRLRAEGVVGQRDYGGSVISRQVGIKGGAEYNLSDSQRLGFQVDARHTRAFFDHGYDGWQIGGYATYERVVARSMIASANIFVRRDALADPAYANSEIGGVVGLGGELPKGFNFGISAGVSHAKYDAASFFFSLDPRRDWRYNARLTLGNRAIRLWGFSPSFSVTYAGNASSITYYTTQRTRFRFALARYF
ncbi:surface lipoprotein assembly modifier [Sphingomonas sp. AR_OL41]|uniref:surface lipoprotein assembly modifier n=1 Tax=Sphingomonas sp. AR_OL41 TaxID=3042729 RepID=UPI0024817672|nr:surface lipoprotein assembly modifier [Sphingomonas sp. AR_OL41]MDH7971478.1 surface lipoprotein assembly modifier [Sphingomonas sp. AR_OL41]